MRNYQIIMESDPDQQPRHVVYFKMEHLICSMQHADHGVPVRPQKMFLTTIPDAFAGVDLIDWLFTTLKIEDRQDALHLAFLFCQYGYLFPVSDQRHLVVKDDNTLYRFQAPYYWPSQNWKPDHVDYAIYLAKRTLRNKQKHGLDDHEQVAFNKLQKMLAHKWEFVFMQAEEQVKQIKERKKADKIIVDSQEKAFWRVQRPPPGTVRCLDEQVRRNFKPTLKKRTVETCQREVNFLGRCMCRPRMKMSKAVDGLITRCEQYLPLDPLISGSQPSNPWISDDTALWEYNTPLVDNPTERRVRRWMFSLEELLSDLTGRIEFEEFLKKEYSQENIRFWRACEVLKFLPKSQVADQVKQIYNEFLAPGAPCEVNVDGKTMDITQKALENPTRFTFEAAQDHILLLMKKDSYPRFLRSEEFKILLETAQQPSGRKRFFNFGSTKSRKSPLLPSPANRRRGSETSNAESSDGGSGSLNSVRGHHSYSTGNLESLNHTPYRGDIVKKRSSVDSKRGMYIGKKLDKLELSGPLSKDTLTVPDHYEAGPSLTEDTSPDTNKCLPIAVPSKSNIVAPWETAG